MAIALATQPDAILLDVVMPEPDGLTTLRLLHQHAVTQQIPVILLTATIKAVTYEEYSQLGAKAVLIKPFDPGTLANQIETVLGWNNS
jgi:CheY-like chemotaxis protein